MKKLSTIISAAALALAAQSQASVIDATAGIQLSGVYYDASSVSFGIDYANDYNFFGAVAYTNDTTPLYSESLYNSAAIGGSSESYYSVANGEGIAFSEVADSYVNSFATVYDAGMASASSLNELAYTASGYGDVTLSFIYEITGSIEDAIGTEFLEAVVSVTDSLAGYDIAEVYLDGMYGDDSFVEQYSFDLTFSVDGLTSGIFSLESNVFADSGVTAVSAPGTFFLMVIGVLGLIHRRKNT